MTTLLSPAEFLARGLALPPLPPPQVPPPGSRCALTGQPLAHGYPAGSILPSSTGDPLDVLGGGAGGWLSEEAARVLSFDSNLGSRALFQEPDGRITTFYPRLTSEKDLTPEQIKKAAEPPSAQKQKLLARDGSLPRPLWRDLVRDVWPWRESQPCLLLLATDPKKRVWYKARVGALGEQTPLYLFDNARSEKRPLTLSWPRLVETLDFVEEIYAAGFTKRGMETFLPSETAALKKCGMARAMAWEHALAALRPSPEFLVSVIIAQKPTAEEKPTAEKPSAEAPKGNTP